MAKKGRPPTVTLLWRRQRLHNNTTTGYY